MGDKTYRKHKIQKKNLVSGYSPISYGIFGLMTSVVLILATVQCLKRTDDKHLVFHSLCDVATEPTLERTDTKISQEWQVNSSLTHFLNTIYFLTVVHTMMSDGI